MKKIVCEMCECTEFIKEDGLFVCQGCGCKYSLEDAKKITKDIDQEEQNNFETEESETEKLRKTVPIHTENSPNKIVATITKLGHESVSVDSISTADILTGNRGGIIFDDGPDMVGNIGAEVRLENLKGKTIKYATFYIVPYNAVGDPVCCNFRGYSEIGLELTGPVNVGQYGTCYADAMWCNSNITHAKITYIHVIYMDGTEELYDYNDIVSYNKASQKTSNDSIPLHTADSPNKVVARVLGVGHSTYTASSMIGLSTLIGGEPTPVFVDGPDEVGNIGAKIYVENQAGKTIKYITVFLIPFNAVGDSVCCTVSGHYEYGIEVTGPLAVGDKWEGYLDGMWYNNSIVKARINRIHVIYTDGTEELYDYSKHTDEVKSSKTRKITIVRNWAYTGCAVKLFVYKDSFELFDLKVKEKKSFTSDDQPFELIISTNKDLKNAHMIMIEAGEKDVDIEVKISMSGKIVSSVC